MKETIIKTGLLAALPSVAVFPYVVSGALEAYYSGAWNTPCTIGVCAAALPIAAMAYMAVSIKIAESDVLER